jgi:hypothetical protein
MNSAGYSSISKWRLLRTRIRKLPLLGFFAGLIGDIQRFVVKTTQQLLLPKIRIYEVFEALAPNSAGTPKQRTDLTKNTILNLFPELGRLTRAISKSTPPEVLSIEAFIANQGFSEADASRLKDLFMELGSDKASPNNYYKLYAYLLSAIENPENVLEIGLGSNNLNVVSNMGVYGRPGASIRAFRDYLPSSNIYGADIDRGALFIEKRIITSWVDQTNYDSLESMFDEFGVKFDLVIDDGLHSPDANIATLTAAFSRCNSGGYIVIEDVAKSARDIWSLVQEMFNHSGIDARILSGTNADVFLVKVP